MGTNYFSVDETNNITLHIGKKSAGWQFIFHAHPSMNLFSYEDWSEYLTSDDTPQIIENEYGERIEAPQFLDLVVKSRKEKSHYDEAIKFSDYCGWKDKHGYSVTLSDFS